MSMDVGGTPSDTELMARTESDVPDFSTFFRREYPVVLRTVFLILRDRGRAEELCQEAFVVLLRHWRRVGCYDRPEAWVRRVAIRLALRQLRRERLRSMLERQSLVTADDGEGATLDMADKLRQLSPPQRTAIVLHYYEDQPINQIALIMACSENTVKSHLHRGRSKLHGLLQADRGGVDGL
jgi:RNA polymerase sigma factor (sigma-70 family)